MQLLTTCVLMLAAVSVGCANVATGTAIAKTAAKKAAAPASSSGFRLYGSSRVETALALVDGDVSSPSIVYATEAQVASAIEVANGSVMQAAQAEAKAIAAATEAKDALATAAAALEKAKAAGDSVAAASAAAQLAEAKAADALAQNALTAARADTLAEQTSLALVRAQAATDLSNSAEAKANSALARAQQALDRANSTRALIPFANVKEFGAVGDGVTDDTAAINRAIQAASHVHLPAGLYLVDPAVSVKVKGGLTLTGAGDDATVLVAKPVPGSLIRREAPKQQGDYVTNVSVKGIGVVMTHPATASPANYEQIAFDFRSITRSTISECYAGNYPRGPLNRPTPGHADAIQGYGVVFGTLWANSPLYSGGEVNTAERLTVHGAKKCVVIDDAVLSPLSAAYATTIANCDLQIAELGVGIEQRYNTGVNIRDNTIAAIERARGSVNQTYVYRIEGHGNLLSGGYIESAATADHIIYLGALSRSNVIRPHRLETGQLTDLGSGNDVVIVENGQIKHLGQERFTKGVLLGSSGGTALSSYEEGAWTPVVAGSTVSGVATYAIQAGNYTKVGRMVTCIGQVSFTGATGAGKLRIRGLPFPSKSVSQGHVPVLFNNSATTSGRLPPSMSEIWVENGAGVEIGMPASGQYLFSVTYFI